ncbi:hypothetical protein WA026_023170 [Henosepilachna vigintioctopunctata]|uniref:ABC-2 type transporter transmembrane domain-containing protein n=1 Tax=Henosepilachna vigintioctopunctata TaxID=420089 RepID=A0AAW1UNM9_9CUCU
MKISKAAQEVEKSVDTQSHQWTYNHKIVIPYKVGWFSQMKALLWRSWMSILRKPEVTKSKLIIVIVEAFFFSIIYYGQILNQYGIKNLDGVFAFYVTNVTYQNVYGTINTFCSEIPLFTKENKDGMYRTDTYYLSKIICDIPISCVLAMLYPAIGYYFIGFNLEFSRYLTALLIMALVSQTALGAGYIISVILPRLEHADAGINILLFPLLIFGGFFLSIGSVPTYLQWLADLSWFKYGYEMFMINQWYGIPYIQCNTNFSESSDCIFDGAEVLSTASIYPVSRKCESILQK